MLTIQNFIQDILIEKLYNIDADGLVIRAILQNIRETLVSYNTNQIVSILDLQIRNYNETLNQLGIFTNEQFEQRVEEFNSEIDS